MPYSCGTTTAYQDGCRCTDCRAANAAAHRAWRERARKRPKSELRHGVLATYANYDCRCEPCKQAMSDYYADWYLEKKLEGVA